jgi:hypothetical protein
LIGRWVQGIASTGVLVALVAGSALAQSAARDSLLPASYTIRPAVSTIEIDARLNEPAWEEATAVSLPYEWSPGDNVPAPVGTTCRMTFDADALYIGCHALDPDPSRIRAYLRDRDDGFLDDHVVITLDTFDDERHAFEFRVTALGVQMDALFAPNEGVEDFSWDTIWDSSGRIVDDGYIVEVAIPFKSLRFPDTEEVQTWGFFLERSWPRSARHRMSSNPRDRDNNCLLCQANKVTGFVHIAPGRDIELDPTLTARRTDERHDFPEGDLEAGDADIDAGLTARWGMTPNVTLSGTVNPDFSQVEADAAQLDVNTRFALFFPEKRPFFLEGADIFEIPGDLVFTRTVADPEAGSKLTGKIGPHTFGAFVTRDGVNNLVFPGPFSSDQTSLGDDVTGIVARYRRDVGQASTIGTLVTSREANPYHNRVGAIDGSIRLSQTQRLQFLATYSRTDYPAEVVAAFDQPAGDFGGEGAWAEWGYGSRNWFGGLAYTHVADDYRADFGFVPQVGYRGPEFEIGRVFWGSADRWFNRITIEVDGYRQDDQGGELIDQEVEPAVSWSGPLQSFVRFEFNLNDTAFARETFDLVRPVVIIEMQPRGWLGIDFFATWGDQIDFANARKADNLLLEPALELRLGRPLSVALRHTYQRLSLEGDEIFTAKLSQLRALYHFNVRSFVRVILQYRDVDRNPALYQDPVTSESRQLFTQLLFSYKVNPQTVLFAGYTDTRLGGGTVDLTQNDRTFFIKLGYAWRL